ncbi:MAG: TrbI/VirB10 family protein [Nostoc sp. ChiSLP02]|nr:TrbI/VirB10 family protein [Nostoc sp. DedSLP05]MDZ8101369.1 TrbI/VirB10 family protein [Nostoc sp. DedSLP01]MDZ8185245.1 TrbI/VirB10 family protein [Nostoc sp. ChiSLP02]
MTKYSVSTETHPPNLLNLDTDHRPVESLDWESRIARLVGFEEEFSSDAHGGQSLRQISEDSEISQPSLEPEEVKTEQPLSSNPFAKLSLVGAATLAVVLVAGVFLSQLMSSSNQKPRNIVTQQVQPQPTNQSTPEQLKGEIEILKTKLALTQQTQTVKAAQEQLRMARSTPTAVSQLEPSSSGIRRQQVIPTPAPTVYVPRPVTVERIVRVPAPQASPRPQLPVLQSTTQPVVSITPPPPPNPFDEWTKLAKLGSYGQVNAIEQPNNVAAASQPQNEVQSPQQTPNPNPNENPNSQVTPEQGNAVVAQGQPQGEKSVAIGTSAKAVFATAIFGETTRGGNEEGTANKNTFVVRLKEPLKSTNGEVALPANTEFLTEISSLSEQGLLQMKVVKFISKVDGNLIEQNLPDNAIIIRGAKGRPLIANKFPNQSSSIASMDLGLFVLGGIGKAAELMNRTDGQVVTINGGSTVVSNTNSGENIAAGIVEGGMNSVVPQIAQRNQQAIAQMSQQTNIWFVPAGTNIEIYVNQVMQF